MKTFKRLLSVVTALAMVTGLCAFSVFADTDESSSSEVAIVLSDDGITVDGEAVSTSDDDAVYIANDIIYYEDLDVYEDTGYTYGEGTDEDKHSEEEAAAHTVVHITEAGTYRISGTLSCGQIFIDLGDDAEEDSTAVVTLILDGVDITCTVAPAVLFYSVYECDTAWVEDEDNYTASAIQDTTAAGANVIIADGSENNIHGSYVAKIYKNNGNNKKLYKFDGAFYSKMSMNVDGEEEDTGVLNIYAEYEGLDSELHLTINGGIVNIQSQDDGINTNEDNVSVTTINGGSVHILAGLGDEGDGIDSNGYLVINGGVVISIANPNEDSGLDSDCGSYINGGTVLATGSTMDWSDEDTASGLGTQPTMNLQFEEAQDSDEAIIITDSDGNVIFAYDPDQDETTGSYNRGYQGAIVSCSELEVGGTYYVYIGGTVSGTDTNGLYDTSTITAVSGAVRQIYTGTDVGMDNMPGTGNDSGSGGDMNGGDTNGGGDMNGGDSGSTFPGGDSNGGDSGSTFPGGDSNSGGTDNTDPDAGVMPLTDTLSVAASYAVEEGTVYSNQFYLTDYVNDFSGVQDDPDYVSDDTGTDDGNTGDGNTDDGNTDDGNTDDGNTDDGNTGDSNTDDGNTGDGNTDDGNTDDGNTDNGNTDGGNTDDGNTDDGNIDDGNTDNGNTDDGTSDGTSSGNWDSYLEYLISYTEENYDAIAAPDYSSTVEELTAAIAELTEDTYSSSILYAVVTELGGALTYEEWLAEYGTADDGTTDDGTTDDGSTDDGTTDDGSADNGSTDNGTSDNGSTDDGTTDNGSTDDGTSDNGSADNGSTDNGTSDDGSADEGSADDSDDAGDSSDDSSGTGSDDADDASDGSGSSDDEAEQELAQAIENAETLIAAAAGLDSGNYSSDSWAAYLSAVEYLEALLADGTADAAEIEAAIAAVEEAYSSLAAASASGEEENSDADDSGEDEDSSEEDEDSDADDSSDTDAAEVGDTSALAFWFVLAAICIFALALTGIKKSFRC